MRNIVRLVLFSIAVVLVATIIGYILSGYFPQLK